ncbi:GpE family phage tail protein [Sphingomonas koreensis]|nr:GpE family phage tail protein [Sphingomonas koreensis]RSU71025.1 GpE family phage tail protein [Sphingomonas koreensis]
MADIAAIFHWPLSELRALEVDELIFWRDLAVQRWNEMQGTKDE